MLDLQASIKKSGWTQKEAAEILGETQLRISNLMHGEISCLSVDSLIRLANRLGIEAKIEEISHVI